LPLPAPNCRRGGNVLEIAATPGRLNAIAHVLDVAEIEPFVLRKKNNEFGGGGIIGAGAANSHGFDGSTQTSPSRIPGFGNGSVWQRLFRCAVLSA
jgi:hypothetical protein